MESAESEFAGMPGLSGVTSHVNYYVPPPSAP